MQISWLYAKNLSWMEKRNKFLPPSDTSNEVPLPGL